MPRPRRGPCFTLWYGECREHAEYVIRNTALHGLRCQVKQMRPTDRSFVDNPEPIRRILYLDRPDVIVTAGDPPRPTVGIEFSAEAPSGHDAFQRFARIVAAAELGTPFGYVFPERKWVERAGQGRWDEYNPLVFRALLQVARFHSVPALAFLWAADRPEGDERQGFLLCEPGTAPLPQADHTETRALWEFVNLAITSSLERAPFSEMVFTPYYAEREAVMWQRYHERAGGRQRWSPLTACETIPTASLPGYMRERAGVRMGMRQLPEALRARPSCIVYRNDSTRFRGDPYAGALIAVDYLTCREGPTPQHRHTNLCMHFADAPFDGIVRMSQRYHREECPLQCARDDANMNRYFTLHLKDGCRYTKQKEIRTICAFADVVIFRDGVLF